jgi:hypothetical protein
VFVVIAQLALVILLECLEFLPRPAHLLVRSILHLPDVCLGGTVLGAKGGGFALELLEMNLQAIALLGDVLDLAGQLVDPASGTRRVGGPPALAGWCARRPPDNRLIV